ncbi:MAG: O-antigen ligase family protein [Thermomicrobiales bacterium]|nr:O-antigen ligase family protein [Thermomicrobiales bacterium]
MSSSVGFDQWRRRLAPFDRDVLALAILVVLGALLSLTSISPLSAGLLIAAAVVAIWRPTGAAWAIGAALPTVAHPVSVGNSVFTLLELAILVAFLGFSWSSLVSLVRTRRLPWSSADGDFVVPLFMGASLLTAGVLSLVFQLDPGHRAEALRVFRWTIVEPLMLFFVMRRAILDRGARPLFWVVVGTGAVTAALALVMLAVDPGRFEGDGVPRALAPYLHPNNLALYLERVFVLLAGAVILGGVRLSRWTLVLGCVMGCALLLTFSRGMVPAVVAGVVLAAWMARNRRLVAGAVVAAAGGGVVLMLAVAQRSRGDSLDDFVGERRYVWSAAGEMIRDYPVSGIGMDQFLSQHAPRYIAPEAWSERYLSHPHNLFLDVWLSLGVSGVLLLVVAMSLLVRVAVQQRESERWIAGAATAALIAGLVHGLVDNGYFLPDLATMTWILIAMIATPDAMDAFE